MKKYSQELQIVLLFIGISFQVVGQKTDTREIKRLEKFAQEVTIIRDNWGIPHIYGKTDADAVFGLLYAQYNCASNFYDYI